MVSSADTQLEAKMPRPKKPRMAQLEEVEISREGDTAIIQYRDPAISTVHFRIGPDAGWGMRVSFVPADEIDQEPEVVVREPNDDETIQPPRVPGG